MNTKILGLTVVASIALLVGGAGQASASTACSGNEYTASNGTETLPGTSLPAIGSCLEIGAFSESGGNNTSPGFISDLDNPKVNPSIYSFTWGGGNLEIQEELGNNGSSYYIDVELGLLSDVTLNTGTNGGNLIPTSPYTLAASIVLPYSSGAATQVFDGNLAAGTYVLDTYFGDCEVADDGSNCSSGLGSGSDPEYETLFTPGATTPLPATLPLFATGLALAGMFGSRRRRKSGAATA
jgi:hypothetical protein